MNSKDSDGDGDDGTKLEDWDDMYQNKIDEENRSGGDEVDDGDEVDGGEGFNGGEDEGGYSGKKIKGGNGEGSRIASAKQAGTKRKVTQDDEPATATRMKRKKLNGSEAHPAANTKKVLPKRKYSKEWRSLGTFIIHHSLIMLTNAFYSQRLGNSTSDLGNSS